MAIEETAEEIAHRFLTDYHSGDTALVDGWKRNADRRWCLALQLCKSFVEEIEALHSAIQGERKLCEDLAAALARYTRS